MTVVEFQTFFGDFNETPKGFGEEKRGLASLSDLYLILTEMGVVAEDFDWDTLTEEVYQYCEEGKVADFMETVDRKKLVSYSDFLIILEKVGVDAAVIDAMKISPKDYGSMTISDFRKKLINLCSDYTPATGYSALILGSNPAEVEEGSIYFDEGAIVLDEEGNIVKHRAIVDVDTSVAASGQYTVTYVVIDQHGDDIVPLVSFVRNVDVVAPTASLSAAAPRDEVATAPAPATSKKTKKTKSKKSTEVETKETTETETETEE